MKNINKIEKLEKRIDILEKTLTSLLDIVLREAKCQNEINWMVFNKFIKNI